MEHMEVRAGGGGKTSSWWSPQGNHHQLGCSYSVFSEIHVRLCKSHIATLLNMIYAVEATVKL